MASILQEGQLIELELEKASGEMYKFRTIVEMTDSGDLFSVYAPMYKGATYPLLVGDVLSLFFSRLNRSTGKYEVFSCKTQVVSRLRKDNIALVRLSRLTDVVMVQRRDTYRLSYVKKMALTVVGEEGKETIEMLSRDISVGGLRGVIQQSLNENQQVICHVYLGDGEKLDFKGYVLTCQFMPDSRVKYDVRIKFIKPDSNTMKKLVRFIQKAQSDMIKKMSSSKHEQRMLETLGAEHEFEVSQRKKHDLIYQWVNYAPILLWVLFAASVLLFISGMPATEYPLQRFFNFVYRRGWNYALLQTSLIATLFTLGLSAVSIVLNRMRLKRSYDYFRATFFILLVLCIVLIIVTGVLLVQQG